MKDKVDESKRFHILSDAGLGWYYDVVDSADTLEEAKDIIKEIRSWCDPNDVLAVRDTQKKGEK